MTRSRRILALLGMLLVLALAGCVRFQADLTVDPDNTLDGDIVVAVVSDHGPGSDDNARENAATIEAQLLPALRGSDGVTAEPYQEDDYLGTRFTLRDTPIEALDGGDADGALTLTRLGNRFEFSGTLDFTPDDEPLGDDQVQGDPADSGISVAIGFPGEVLEHNGELDGTKVTWTTTLEGSVDMHAVASAERPTPSPLVVLGILVAALVAALLLALLVLVLIRRRQRSAPPTLPM